MRHRLAFLYYCLSSLAYVSVPLLLRGGNLETQSTSNLEGKPEGNLEGKPEGNLETQSTSNLEGNLKTQSTSNLEGNLETQSTSNLEGNPETQYPSSAPPWSVPFMAEFWKLSEYVVKNKTDLELKELGYRREIRNPQSSKKRQEFYPLS